MGVRSLHVVALDVPYPPDYGVVIDVYYRLRALQQAGIAITLHCFAYGRKPAAELERLCKTVWYYPRPRRLADQLSVIPFIVRSRRPQELLRNLLADDAPILFDGLHTCSFLPAPQLAGRRKAVRMQNVEWQYYRHLARYPSSLWKRIYYLTESIKLRWYERILHHADLIFTVSRNDEAYYRRHHRQVHYLPVFHAHEQVSSLTGSGNFLLYHGKLSVPENEQAARFILRHVAGNGLLPLVIAGRNPSASLQRVVAKCKHAELIINPTEQQLNVLLQQAHIHLLPTFQATGIKHKLLQALFAGRHVVVNPPMVAGTGLEPLCHVGDTAALLRRHLENLHDQPFTEAERLRRQTILLNEFDNRKNADRLVSLMGL
ncbi:MAG: glycosyltransferase [Chitinophagales bacterium]|nr:glycosyltransferase [Chitinophagales bacterium]MDW8392696.1 glycosyltransferase [Chitinophagales bacterium]